MSRFYGSQSVPDFQLGPPEAHREYCQCDFCEDFHADKGREHFFKECPRCEDIVARDIDRGVRCSHGEFIPFLTVAGYITDMECEDCQIDYGPTFEPTWQARFQREAA